MIFQNSETNIDAKLRRMMDLQVKARQKPKKRKRKKPKSKPKNPPKVSRTRRFEETPLGYGLQYHCPVEFSLLVDQKSYAGPNPDLIEEVSYISQNPWFRTVEFRLALSEYRQYRLRGTPYRPDAAEKLRLLRSNKQTLHLLNSQPLP